MRQPGDDEVEDVQEDVEGETVEGGGEDAPARPTRGRHGRRARRAAAPQQTRRAPPPAPALEDGVVHVEYEPLPSDEDVEAVEVPWKASDIPPQPETTEYWIGVTSDSPLQNMVLGGTCFPRYSRQIPVDKDGNVQRDGTEVRGMRVRLTDSQLEVIKVAAARQMIRRSGVRSTLFDVRSKYFQVNPNSDLPAGAYAYMVPIRGSMPVDFQDSDPPPMIRIDKRR